MKILFITSTRLGDSVLSTGALNHFVQKYPEAEITVVCGPLVAGIFEQAPHVNRVIALKKEPYALHWYKLWMETVGTSWDIVIDLRNSLMSRLIRAKEKYIWGKQDNHKHKVEQIAEVIGVSPPPAPFLWFNNETRIKAESFIPGGSPVLAIGPAAKWRAKTWPAENFIALANTLTAPDSILPEARIAVFAAPGEEETAYKVLQSIPESRRINMIAKASPIVVAAALQRCHFYVGNDSGLMHCAAAVGIPTLGLFGPSWPHLYHPWGSHCAHATTPQNYDDLINYPGFVSNKAPSLMTSLTVTTATTTALELWKKSTQMSSKNIIST